MVSETINPNRPIPTLPLLFFLLPAFWYFSTHWPLSSLSWSQGQARSSPSTHKAYGIKNIKTYVPVILDLTAHNYQPWSDLFRAHYIAYDVLDHIDDT